MKLVCISDTHNRHDDIVLPQGDILIHAGDFTSRGTKEECVYFLNWFAQQHFKHKILIAGNHDFFFEDNTPSEIDKIFPKGIIYLNDTSITIDKIKFHGSPVTPFFNNWAFNRERGSEIKAHWDKIPNDTDVLITHGPPMNILDSTVRGKSVGCEELSKAVNRVKPKAHIFGHIHEGYGMIKKDDVIFVNASLLNERYYYTNDFFEIEI